MFFISIKYHYLKIFLAVLFCTGFLVIPLYFTHALTISPARVEISGDPGQIITGEYSLANKEDETKTYYSSFENFEAQGETGSPNFVVGHEGLASWISASSEVVLGPQETKELQYSITIPEDADPGGHFAAIFWGTSKPNIDEESGQVSVAAKIGLLVLLRVSGDIEEGGGVLGFKAFDKEKEEEARKSQQEPPEGQKFFTILPVDLSYRFQNSGGDRIKPKGTVIIKNTFGMVSNILDANKHSGNILPTSIRKFELSWNGVDDTENIEEVKRLKKPEKFWETVKHQASHFAFGMYTAHLELKYGVDNTLESVAQYRFFVFPWQLVIVILPCLFVIIFLVKMYNKAIIKRAQKNNTVNNTDESAQSNSSETQKPDTE